MWALLARRETFHAIGFGGVGTMHDSRKTGGPEMEWPAEKIFLTADSLRYFVSVGPEDLPRVFYEHFQICRIPWIQENNHPWKLVVHAQTYS